MTAVTIELHSALIRALGSGVLQHSDIRHKPLDLDLAFPLPPSVRIYMYTLVRGGVNRKNEYKAVLRVPRQNVGAYGSLSHRDGRFTLLIGYLASLEVFALWDASSHFRFKNGGNIQVRETTILEAVAVGFARQWRELSKGRSELVLACATGKLRDALNERLMTTGVARNGKPV
jgi:hypothetical protein